MIHSSRNSLALVFAGALGLISSNAHAQQAPDSDEILQVPVEGADNDQADEATPDESLETAAPPSAGCAVAPPIAPEPSVEAPAVQMPVTVQSAPASQSTQTVSVAPGSQLRIRVVVYGPNGVPQSTPAPAAVVVPAPAPVQTVYVQQPAPQVRPQQMVWVPTHYEYQGPARVRVRRGWQMAPVVQSAPAPIIVQPRTIAWQPAPAPVIQTRRVIYAPPHRSWHQRHRGHFFGRGF